MNTRYAERNTAMESKKFTGEQLERYSRHFVLTEIGMSGQAKLLSSKILVIGAGAIGSSSLIYLAAAGVGTLGIADCDNVELSNLQRQIIHNTDSVGTSKLESAKNTIKKHNPDVKVILHEGRVTPENINGIISAYDFIIDATDNFETKFLINDACVLGHKPYSHAGIVRFEGQATTYVPEKGPCLRCLLGRVPPPSDYSTCAQIGVLGAATGITGSIQACEAIKYVLGIGNLLTDRVLKFDALTMNFQTIKTPHALSECSVCGTNPTITSLIENKAEYERS